MLTVRPGDKRGSSKFDWLDSRHTFSFGDYHDPQHMGFSHLRVINEDRVVPGAGFPTHSHRDMEIITYVLEGALAHKDSTGTSSVIRVGDVQRMSAGRGINHSEYNASQTEPVHFLQIWIVPNKTGLAPGYEQRAFSLDEHRDKWTLIALRSRTGWIRHSASGCRCLGHAFFTWRAASFSLKPSRNIWTQVVRGAAKLNGMLLNAGDGAAINEESTLELKALDHAEILVFDLA